MSTVYTNEAQRTEQNSANATGRVSIAQTDGSIKAPKNVIKTESGARIVAQRLMRNSVRRLYNYERVRGMEDGNPPYNAARMRLAGVNDMTNVNFKDFEAIFGGYVLSFWSLFNDVQYLAQIEVNLALGDTQNAFWGKVLSAEWDYLMKTLWEGFNTQMGIHQADLCRIGIQSLVWFNEKDWRYTALEYDEIFFPDNVETDIDKLTCFTLKCTYTAQELFGFYEKAKESKDNKYGVWDAKALESILFRTANIPDDKKGGDVAWTGLADIQREISNNNIQIEELYNDLIHFTRIYQKEYDGKVSTLMIHRTLPCDQIPYYADRQYKNMREALGWFTFRKGKKLLHSVKGIGQSIFSTVEATTRLDCSVLDQAMRAGSLLIKSGPTRGTDARQIRFVHGGVIDIGEADVQQNQMGQNLNGSIAGAQYFRGKLMTNNNMSGLDPATPDRDRAAKPNNPQALREARIQKNVVSHYYDQLNLLFQETFRKQLASKEGYPGYELVALFKERCLKRGVPKEIFDMSDLAPNGLPKHLEIYASRASGSGSQAADQQEMSSIMAILPTLGERGRENAMEDYVTVNRGFRYVSRYMPPEDRQKQPVQEDTQASIENNQLAEGKQIVVSPDSNHYVHATNHIRLLKDAMEQFLQVPQAPSELLQKVDTIFAAAGPHLTRHLFFLQQDPTRRQEMEGFRAQWAVLANFGDMIKNNAARSRQAELDQATKQNQKVDKVTGELQIKAQQAEGDQAIKQQKLEADVVRDKNRDQYKFMLASQAQRNKDWLASMKTVAELSLQAKKDLQQDTVDIKAD